MRRSSSVLGASGRSPSCSFQSSPYPRSCAGRHPLRSSPSRLQRMTRRSQRVPERLALADLADWGFAETRARMRICAHARAASHPRARAAWRSRGMSGRSRCPECRAPLPRPREAPRDRPPRARDAGGAAEHQNEHYLPRRGSHPQARSGRPCLFSSGSARKSRSTGDRPTRASAGKRSRPAQLLRRHRASYELTLEERSALLRLVRA